MRKFEKLFKKTFGFDLTEEQKAQYQIIKDKTGMLDAEIIDMLAEYMREDLLLLLKSKPQTLDNAEEIKKKLEALDRANAKGRN